MLSDVGIVLVLVTMVVSFWLGRMCGRHRPAVYNIQEQLDLNQIRRQADGIRRQGDDNTHFQPNQCGTGRVRERPRTGNHRI